MRHAGPQEVLCLCCNGGKKPLVGHMGVAFAKNTGP